MDVSVIIASWNAAVYLPRCIASALAQRGVSVEVLVCDDASTDDTESVMRTLSDPRVRYIRLDPNGGPSAARNSGLAAARGEWLLVLDADDLMERDRAAELVRLGRRTGADVVADNLQLVGSDGALRRLLIDEALDQSHETIDLESYLRRNLSGQHGLGYLKPLMRRAFLIGHGVAYRESLRIGEDFAIVCDTLTAGARFVRSRSAGYLYTVHERSTSHRINLAQLDAMIAYDDEWLQQNGWRVGDRSALAMREHLADLRKLRAFNDMVGKIKALRLKDFLLAACKNPSALGHFRTPVRARIERLRARLGVGPNATRQGAL